MQDLPPPPDSLTKEPVPPPQPPRPEVPSAEKDQLQPEQQIPTDQKVDFSETQLAATTQHTPDPQHYGEDVDNPVHYTRDPHRLIAYLVPFPKPDLGKPAGESTEFPERFLIYTPPPPPIPAPKEGEKEARMQKVQRKWQNEIREAKMSDAKVTSWKGAKSRAMKGINKAMNWTTTSSLDFINRIPGADTKKQPAAGANTGAGDDDSAEGDTTHKTVGLQEMVLVYPDSLPGTQEEIRTEFVNSMLRTKSKAQRDAIIATGLLPVGFAVDVMATLVWPFGGLAEIDAVWGYSSMRGAKTARSVTKRLNSSTPGKANSAVDNDQHKLRLTFTPSPRLDVLRRYLYEQCHKRDARLWRSEGVPPTETEVLDAIGWKASSADDETRNWEDEQWELTEVKDDLKSIMSKGSKEWEKWCKAFQKDPQKAVKK